MSLDPLRFRGLIDFTEKLASGVFGYGVDTERGLYIPVVTAEKEGNGDVGRFLDSLPTDRRVVFPTVISSRLAGMLERRGFVSNTERAGPPYDEDVDIWERLPVRPDPLVENPRAQDVRETLARDGIWISDSMKENHD